MSGNIDTQAAEIERLRAENARLHRACSEGLPRERINCPACGMLHIDGADASGYGERPHHTHLCQPENGGCGHVFDTGRWSFGADVADDDAEPDAAMAVRAARRSDIAYLRSIVNAEHPDCAICEAYREAADALERRMSTEASP